MKHGYWTLRLWTKLAIKAIGLGPCLIEFCKVCGRKQPLVWRARDDIWEQFSNGKGVLCPECFDYSAEQHHVLLIWRPEIDR
jgi:hypothetical protein